VLEDLCGHAHLKLVAQYFEQRDTSAYMEISGKKSLAETLDFLAIQCNMLWSYNDGYIVISSRFLVDDLD